MQPPHRGLQSREAGCRRAAARAEARSAANSATSAGVTSLESTMPRSASHADVAGEIAAVRRDRVLGQSALDRDVPQVRVHRPFEPHVTRVARAAQRLRRGEHADRQDAVAQPPLEHAGDGIRAAAPTRCGCRPPRPRGRARVPTGDRPRARKRCTTSSLPPGVVKMLTSGSQSAATRSASSTSSRFAVSSGDSPAMSSSPAGISQSRWRIGCRYCWISSTRSSLVDRDDRRRAGVIDVLAHDLAVAVADGVAAHVPDRARRRRGRSRRPRASTGSSCSAADAGSRSSAILDVEQLAGAVALEGRADESAEQRMRVGRPRAQLGVRLRRDVVRVHVARQLDVLDEVAVGREARRTRARASASCVAVAVVDLVAVAVALVDARSRRTARRRAIRRRARPGRGRGASCRPGRRRSRMSTCSAIVAMTGYSVSGSNSLRRRALEPGDVACVLDHHALQAQAQAEGRDALLARELQRAELALDAADAESARDDDAVEAAQRLGRAFGRLAQVGRDPA